MQSIIVKGKSDKAPFRVVIPQEELFEVLVYATEKAQGEFDEESATSPGGFPTALFTCLFPAKAREETGWDLKDGWSKEKAIAAFDSRLERKQGGGGFSIESRQAAWDEAWKVAQGYGMPMDAFVKMKGKRPEAKAESVKAGMDELKAAGIV